MKLTCLGHHLSATPQRTLHLVVHLLCMLNELPPQQCYSLLKNNIVFIFVFFSKTYKRKPEDKLAVSMSVFSNS